MRGLAGKTAVVTGAGSGLGRGMALRLAEEGARVAILDINAAGGAATSSAIEEAGGSALSLVLDITDYQACAEAVQRVQQAFDRIDVLVNNAGWDAAATFVDSDPALWRKIIDINLYGPLNMHHVTLPLMMAGGGGKIINIASDAGRIGSSGEAVYSACKGGVIAFGKSVSREMARHGIVVNTVCPGPSDTPLFENFAGNGDSGRKLREALTRAMPLRRLGTADDIAGIVAFLASDDANFIIGQTISVSGGLTMHG